MATFYAQRKSIKNGEPQTPNNRYGERDEMLRQYFLYCAASATNADENDFDSVEFGTVEQGAIKVERFDHPVQVEEPAGE